MRIVCSRRFSWNIVPYFLFLKKRQNLKLSSAANYRWALWVNQLKQHTNHACSEIYSHSLNELSEQKQKSIDPLDGFHPQNKKIFSEGVQLCQLFFFSWLGEWGSKYHYEQAKHLPASETPFKLAVWQWWPNVECWLRSFVIFRGSGPGPDVIKLFSCSTQLSTKFQLLIKTKIPTNNEFSCFKSLRCCIYHANKCLNKCWHFNIYEQDKFRAQLSWVWKKFYDLGASILLRNPIFLFLWFFREGVQTACPPPPPPPPLWIPARLQTYIN